MRWLEAATVQCLLCKVSCAEGEDSLAGLREQLQAERERQRYRALGLPSLHWSSCIFICFINWSPLWLHLNKSILLFKTWLKTIGFGGVFLCYHLSFLFPTTVFLWNMALTFIYLSFGSLCLSKEWNFDMRWHALASFSPKHVLFYVDGLKSFCALLLLFKPQNCYFIPSLRTG